MTFTSDDLKDQVKALADEYNCTLPSLVEALVGFAMDAVTTDDLQEFDLVARKQRGRKKGQTVARPVEAVEASDDQGSDDAVDAHVVNDDVAQDVEARL